MGSGIRNLYKYTKIYSGGEPELIEGDVFKTIVPLKTNANGTGNSHANLDGNLDGTTNQVTVQDSTQDNSQHPRADMLIEFCSTPRTREEMQEHLGIANRGYFRTKVLKPLLDVEKLRMTIPDKPNSRNQKYVRS